MTSLILPLSLKTLMCTRPLVCRQLTNVLRLNSLCNRPLAAASRRHLFTSTSACQRFSDRNQLPQLMNHPKEIVWPSVFKTISGFMQSALIIRPYFDNTFNMTDFSQGAKQALLVISSHLARGDTEGLTGLVERTALNEIRENLERNFSYEKRLGLEVKDLEDVYLSFPYQVGIIMEETDRGVQERFVEITYVFHVFRGLSEISDRDDFQSTMEQGPTAMASKYKDRIMVCNYRFIREFTKGVESPWIVNLVHHFGLLNHLEDK